MAGSGIELRGRRGWALEAAAAGDVELPAAHEAAGGVRLVQGSRIGEAQAIVDMNGKGLEKENAPEIFVVRHAVPLAAHLCAGAQIPRV